MNAGIESMSNVDHGSGTNLIAALTLVSSTHALHQSIKGAIARVPYPCPVIHN